MALTPKRERFCQEYLVDLNATQAAVRAGYSEKTAYSIGHENLNIPEIAARIAELQADRAGQTGVTQEWVIRHLRDEATNTGRGASHAARVTALTQLGKHLGMFEERVKVEQAGKLVIKKVVVSVNRDPHEPGSGPAGDGN